MSKGNQLSKGSNKILSWLFIVLGIVFFLVGLQKFISYIRFTGEKVDAVVVEVDETITHKLDDDVLFDRYERTIYATYVTYTYQGQTYEHIRLDGYDTAYEGTELEVYVNKNDPMDVRLPGNNLYQACVMMIMLPVFGTVAKWCRKNFEE